MAKYPKRSYQDEGRAGRNLGTRIAYSWKSNAIGLIFWAVFLLWAFNH